MPASMHRVPRSLALASGLLLLGACATSGPTPVSPQTPEARQGSSRVPTPAVPSQPDGGAVLSPVDSLLDDARSLRQRGDLGASLARLERALRIAPQRAEVYLEIARCHKAAGRPEQASASAERGLLYCRASLCAQLRSFMDS